MSGKKNKIKRRKVKSDINLIQCTCGNILSAEVVIMDANKFNIIVTPCTCQKTICPIPKKEIPIGLKQL